MAFALFFGTAEDMSARNNFNAMMVVDKRLSSRFVILRCPECAGPNASLTYQGTTGNTALTEPTGDFVLWGHFVPPLTGTDSLTATSASFAAINGNSTLRMLIQISRRYLWILNAICCGSISSSVDSNL
jgi:hypothetical protein